MTNYAEALIDRLANEDDKVVRELIVYYIGFIDGIIYTNGEIDNDVKQIVEDLINSN